MEAVTSNLNAARFIPATQDKALCCASNSFSNQSAQNLARPTPLSTAPAVSKSR
jgi:hypothetical protein